MRELMLMMKSEMLEKHQIGVQSSDLKVTQTNGQEVKVARIIALPIKVGKVESIKRLYRTKVKATFDIRK